MNDNWYSEDDFRPRSPGLERVYVKAAPSPSPPPQVTKVLHPPVSALSSRRLKKANRRKTRPTQGDWVLIREMAPNQPEIAQQVSQQALNSDSGESGPDDEDEMEDQSSGTVNAPLRPNATHPVRSGVQPFGLSNAAKDGVGTGQPTATSAHRDSVVEPDIRVGPFASDRRASEVTPFSSLPNGVRPHANDVNSRKPSVAFNVHSPSPKPQPYQRRDSTAVMQPPDDSPTNLHQLQIPQSDVRLPMIQPQSPMNDAASPASQQQIPSISSLVGDIPRSASISEDPRTNGLVHRQSISSMTASPTSRVRQMSISSHTPASPIPPFSASSPMSANSDLQRGDIFLQSGGGHVFGADARRPSQASANGRYQTLHSASTSDGYQSSDGPSPGSQQTPIEPRPRHMSLDGTIANSAIILPPPNGSGLPQMGSHGAGAFRCDYPGCNALPFQTQYLLNSHTNVHSQNRPHYCPVKGCPRSEGGKGFKRKNEMIRHGLVHQSPGYVCPFCPDREHKYPRPDNLQRHVRVHHVDKTKDDPQLRDVLAQRPEGGSRGRRRRLSG
ncbi:hypothetical protein CC86DRAFT_372283 [Ophiobolus disseminans]|uniref:C2H2-type domain-containing protein n=1 Tax=Ophiobolus disseminans TaxID=1469910 RepID=A0A6A6ZSJ7_9PLEO|nr:hypothetical protein CC86DRAFT_372283 [Ophiobolus disseminans]